MRSKNQVPVQVILPQTSMGSNHSSKKGVFEEALQSSIEASLRSSGTVPSRVFSSLYLRSRPYSSHNRPGPSSAASHLALLPPPDNVDDSIDVKPDISGLNRDLLIRNQGISINSEDGNAANQSSPGTSSTPSVRAPSAHSTLSPREQNESAPFIAPIRGPPPLLLSMPESFVRPGAPVTSNNLTPQVTNGNRFMVQRMPSVLPKSFQFEQVKQAQVEQIKQLQQIQRWHLLQQQRQQVRAATGSLPMSRLPYFNPLMPPTFNRNALVKPGASINGIHGPPSDQIVATEPTSPGSPMFRKGFCKEGKDIRLSTLKRDGSSMAPYQSEYVLVAMSISPTSAQVPTSSGTYQPPDLQSDALVVVAISRKCLPPNEMTKPLLAQCIGCGDGTLHTFTALSSHLNLRTSATTANLGTFNPLQRHARYYVIKDAKMPHRCMRDSAVPWRVNGNGNHLPASFPQLASIYAGNQQATNLNSNTRDQNVPKTRADTVPASQPLRPQLRYKSVENAVTTALHSAPIKPRLSQQSGMPPRQPDTQHKTQPTTSTISPIFIDSPISGPSSHSPTSDNPIQPRVDPDWNSTVKLSENLPLHAGRPLIAVCWEWQQLQSNIQNVHISHAYSKCFEEALSECHDSTISPLTREQCYMVTSQYLSSLGDDEFPNMAGLSAWLGRSRLMLASMRQVQITTAHAVTLARMTIINNPHKIGLVVSQISQAHAINECIASLKPTGPRYHVIAHINGDTILDLCILLTGHASRMAREYLFSEGEYMESVDRGITSQSLSTIQEHISVPHLDNCIASLSSSLRPHHDSKTSFVPMTRPNQPTSGAQFPSDRFPSQDKPETNSPTSLSLAVGDDKHLADENNNFAQSVPVSSTVQDIAEQLFSRFSSLCESQGKIDLSTFTSVQCSFILPHSPASQIETIADITASGVMQELGMCSTAKPSQTDLRKVIFMATSKTKQRFSALCEHVKVNTSTLFVVFHLDAHLHCDSNSVGSEWMSNSCNELLSTCPNFVFVSCTHISQALLNQNTSVSSENILFPSHLKEKSANHSLNDHCSTMSSKEILRNMTFDLHHETESVSVLNSLPQFHSAAVNLSILIRSYIAALALVVPSFQVLSTGKNVVPEDDKLYELTTPTTLNIVRELLSSRKGITVLLRVPSEAAASRIVSDISEARRKLKMQQAFEIMLYGSHMKPRLSDYFLNVLKKHKSKPDGWKPDTLAEVDCIPLFLVYYGKDLPTHLMPRTLRYVDLRLLANHAETLNQSHLLSETSIVSSCHDSSLASLSCESQAIVDGPPVKKRKNQNGGSSSSDEPEAGKNNKLRWKTFDEKDAIDTLRRLSNGKSSESDEFSSEEEDKVVSRKRDRSPDVTSDAAPFPYKPRKSLPCTIVSRSMYKYFESLVNGTEQFMDLPPHSSCEWVSHARPIINGRLNGQQMAEYLRKWVRPLAGHPDCRSPVLEPSQAQKQKTESSQHLLLVTPPRLPVVMACCLFMKKMHRMLVKLLQVVVYDHKSSSKIKPCYAMPNSHHIPQWPINSTILDMEFDASISNCLSTSSSRITNGVQDSMLHESTGGEHSLPTTTCMVGKQCALDVSHRTCANCRSMPDAQTAVVYELSLPNRGVNQHTVCDGLEPLNLRFCIPESESHHFVFQFQDQKPSTLRALNLLAMNEVGPKTPVFSLGMSGARHGLYNLDHTLYASDEDRNSTEGTDSGEADKPRPLHVIVVHSARAEEFKLCWPNSVLMILPESFDDLGTGAMKFAVQCVMQHSVSIKQEQHNAFQEESSTGDIWPFALILDDAAVVWTACSEEELINSSDDDTSDSGRMRSWKNIPLLEALKRIESVPCAERYAAVGFRPWGSQMDVPKCEEDFSGDVVSSGFSKCLLASCVAFNASLATEDLYDITRFLNDDVDWCMRIAAADLPLFRFNDIAVATKVMSSSVRRELTSVSCDVTQPLVSLADSEFTPIPRHPHLLLELHFEYSGDEVFPKSRGNIRHPVLVVDRYISLGSEVCVEFASSKPDAAPWAVSCEKSYCGLLLYCPSAELSQSFLQQFKFTSGATVCVVGRDRSSLRQTVVRLHLENDWHFRLTDEFQTTNATGFRKPLYYLTGVSRSPRSSV